MRTTIFLDRDGVINRKVDGGYVTTWDDFEFLPGALEGMRTLAASGFRLAIITNQRGVALGSMTEEDLAEIHAQMLDRVERAGAGRPRVYACTHEVDSCDCRKPQVGLFLQAQAEDPAISFADSVVIGDSLADVEAAARLGSRAVLVAETPPPDLLAEASRIGARVDLVAGSLLEAARALPSASHPRRRRPPTSPRRSDPS